MSYNNLEHLKNLSNLIRYWILISTTEAGSGHPTSSLSAADLMTTLLFGGFFRFNKDEPAYINNDRLIFSKGHAAPLLYALWAAAGAIDEKELMTLRKFGSRLEGHPTPAFPYAEVATGSLGQGLSIGIGYALNAKTDEFSYRTYVLLGDSELAEGSCYEALQIAVHYKLDNLVGILDVNRLGQRGETMYGHDMAAYQRMISAFGWETITIDGHSFTEIEEAYKKANMAAGKPTMIIARTLKGKGVSFLEDKEGWHGKTLSKEELQAALLELGEVDQSIRGEIQKPQITNYKLQITNKSQTLNSKFDYPKDKPIATRKAYGNALVRLFHKYTEIVVLDAEVSNSTGADKFKAAHPQAFFEMYIAEQNMVGVAVGLAQRGKIPFVSSFAAFLSRAADQIRMSAYIGANVKIVGSHAGVSIGEDGVSQMGLEDIALFRAVFGSVVLYPGDAVATERLVEEAARHKGLVYIRTTRPETPIIYDEKDEFPIGGSKVLKESANDAVTVVAAGITVHEALAAYDELMKEGIAIRVIDTYSIKPMDAKTLLEAARKTRAVITVEDHYKEGGLGEAVLSALSYEHCPVHIMAVLKLPKSGKASELLDYEEISRGAIIERVKAIIHET